MTSHVPSRHATQGFTLIEVLIALAILGILTALVGNSMVRQTNLQRLQSSAAEFAADLSSARGSVFQYNRDATVTVASDGKSYSVRMNDVTRQYPLPTGTTIQPGGTTITYAAPYSILNTTPTTLTVTRLGVDRVMQVRTVGLLGDVILNAQ